MDHYDFMFFSQHVFFFLCGSVQQFYTGPSANRYLPFRFRQRCRLHSIYVTESVVAYT